MFEKIWLKTGRACVSINQARWRRKIYQGNCLAAQAFFGQPYSHRLDDFVSFPVLSVTLHVALTEPYVKVYSHCQGEKVKKKHLCNPCLPAAAALHLHCHGSSGFVILPSLILTLELGFGWGQVPSPGWGEKGVRGQMICRLCLFGQLCFLWFQNALLIQ